MTASKILLKVLTLSLCFTFSITPAFSAPYAAVVMDARTGKVLHSRGADTKLHPASLTKMMTLYIAFEAIERGEISVDKRITITRHAARQPASKLGLRVGQKISLRHLIRAAAIKSANDAATAIAIAISGSEEKFARRMTRTARALGMRNTTFRNANGLTQSGHMSTARDMSILGRHILYDYPGYYSLFSRQTASAGPYNLRNTNRRLLAQYQGADGIKTGYTRAAGYNLVASASRGQTRVIATVFGGRSSATRNARVAQLLDLGFARAPNRVAFRKPNRPQYGRAKPRILAVARSLRPSVRPLEKVSVEDVILAVAQPNTINTIIQNTVTSQQDVADVENQEITDVVATSAPAIENVTRPVNRDNQLGTIISLPKPANHDEQDWGINVGKYASQRQAEQILVKTALAETVALNGANRRIKRRSQGYDAMFTGLSRDNADLACRRLQAQRITCLMIAPS